MTMLNLQILVYAYCLYILNLAQIKNRKKHSLSKVKEDQTRAWLNFSKSSRSLIKLRSTLILQGTLISMQFKKYNNVILIAFLVILNCSFSKVSSKSLVMIFFDRLSEVFNVDIISLYILLFMSLSSILLLNF